MLHFRKKIFKHIRYADLAPGLWNYDRFTQELNSGRKKDVVLVYIQNMMNQ